MAGVKGKSGSGGKRPGAGHPANRAVLARTDPDLLAALDSTLSASATKAAAALDRLVDDPGANPAQVGAAKVILDRVLGRPRAAEDTPEKREVEAELQRLRVATARAELEERRIKIALLRRQAEGEGLTLDPPDFDPLSDDPGDP